MRRGRPRIFTAAQCDELWRRYKAGESILGIGRALCSRASTVRRVFECTGGIAPAQRRRSSRVLSLVEREEISRGIAAGYTLRAIARGLNRAVSTVSQEVVRHGGRRFYRAAKADVAAWESARRPKLCLLAKNRELQRIVAVKLKQDWAPQQIAGWLKDEYPENPESWVSHETIYRSLFVQARGALKKELIGHLRSRRRIRRSRHATDRGAGRGEIVDAVSIRQRPPEVEDRAIPGHWEGDLVEGSRGTFIATLVERRSRFVILVKLADKRTEAVVGALIKAVRKLPTALRRWQRGSNENTNGLLRQYYPKGMDLSAVSQAQLDIVARKLNTRPRETLHWKTPAYILDTSVSTIH
jgi:IS30 family transposase